MGVSPAAFAFALRLSSQKFLFHDAIFSKNSLAVMSQYTSYVSGMKKAGISVCLYPKQDIATGWVYSASSAESAIICRLMAPMACCIFLVAGMVTLTGVCCLLTMRLYISLIVSPSFMQYFPLRLRLSKLLWLASVAKPDTRASGAISFIFLMIDAALSCGVMYMYASSASSILDILTV